MNIYQVAFQVDPQRSVLGLLLFTLYLNDIPDRIEGRTIMYADDTSILNIGQDINEFQKTTPENTG